MDSASLSSMWYSGASRRRNAFETIRLMTDSLIALHR